MDDEDLTIAAGSFYPQHAELSMAKAGSNAKTSAVPDDS
jgi:hypothetical protein